MNQDLLKLGVLAALQRGPLPLLERPLPEFHPRELAAGIELEVERCRSMGWTAIDLRFDPPDALAAAAWFARHGETALATGLTVAAHNATWASKATISLPTLEFALSFARWLRQRDMVV